MNPQTRLLERQRADEVEAMVAVSAEYNAILSASLRQYRKDMERRWMLEDAGVIDLERVRHERLAAS